MKKLSFAFLFSLITVFSFSQGIDKPKYIIETYRLNNYLGAIEIELFPLVTPLHVNNFDSLVAQHFFDSTAFHRVVPTFVIQGGDPNSISGPINTWGNGQPWQPTVNAEFNPIHHYRGIIGAARDADPNSANSQFYICVGNPTHLDGNYTVFGRVTSGMNIVDSIVTSPRDPNDVPLDKISMFITANGVNPSVPVSPQPVAPVDYATAVLNTQKLSWNTVDSAVLYTYQLSDDSTFNAILLSDTIADTLFTFPAMNGSTQYYWRVRSNNGGHESAWSNTFHFTSTTGPAILTYPPNASTGIPVNLSFNWRSVAAATGYHLQVSTNPAFPASAMHFDQGGIIDTFQVVTGLLPNRLYYWRVQSENGTLAGMYSTRNYFTTGTSTTLQEFNNSGLSIDGPSPNPASESVSLKLTAQKSMDLTIEVRDLAGRALISESRAIRPGLNEIAISVTGLKYGQYIISVLGENVVETRQFVKGN